MQAQFINGNLLDIYEAIGGFEAETINAQILDSPVGNCIHQNRATTCAHPGGRDLANSIKRPSLVPRGAIMSLNLTPANLEMSARFAPRTANRIRQGLNCWLGQAATMWECLRPSRELG